MTSLAIYGNIRQTNLKRKAVVLPDCLPEQEERLRVGVISILLW